MVRHSPERRRHRVCAGEAVLLPEREEALLAAVEGGVLLRSLLDFEFLVSLQALVAGALVVFCAAPWRRPPRTIATRHFGLRQRIQRGLLLGRGVLRAFLAALLCLRGLRPRAFARVCAARASGQGGPRRTHARPSSQYAEHALQYGSTRAAADAAAPPASAKPSRHSAFKFWAGPHLRS